MRPQSRGWHAQRLGGMFKVTYLFVYIDHPSKATQEKLELDHAMQLLSSSFKRLMKKNRKIQLKKGKTYFYNTAFCERFKGRSRVDFGC